MSARAEFVGAISPKVSKKLSAKMIDLDHGGHGVMLRVGPFVATVTEAQALHFADRIVDAVEAGPPRTSRSDLTAADGTLEEPLPATPAE